MKAYKYQLTRNEKNDQDPNFYGDDANNNGDFEVNYILSNSSLMNCNPIPPHVFYPFNLM